MQIISIIVQTHITGDRSATHKRYCLPMPCGRHRASFDHVSEFDRGRIVANREYGLSFREMGQRVGRNQATVMQICHRWMQE
ncbi:hypothetical protein TNCV_1592271 [Trichonephila clavipes]|nr:hypothetical protein TNCV_1592271 [Trichonephila clavipes]